MTGWCARTHHLVRGKEHQQVVLEFHHSHSHLSNSLVRSRCLKTFTISSCLSTPLNMSEYSTSVDIYYFYMDSQLNTAEHVFLTIHMNFTQVTGDVLAILGGKVFLNLRCHFCSHRKQQFNLTLVEPFITKVFFSLSSFLVISSRCKFVQMLKCTFVFSSTKKVSKCVL
jgi:hypothetical protein